MFGVSLLQRRNQLPPGYLIGPLAEALKVSVEELLGIKAEELPKCDKKALLHYLDALVKKNSPTNSRA